ncbi:hypothetical protein [Ancylobacter mangrovi]|uniref:hypothetical protein n=1 Tax=Ancylobacter mangrovi TaxID=2972472 RepID=UPI002162E7C2|nr:hypothetical protein [Ancylobacter mangrovi]MCS0504492.1 hypothetical protein [Ancylobacter mangrovi]
MSAPAPWAAPRLASTAWSVLLIAVAGFTIFHAVQFLRFDRLDRALDRETSGAYWKRDYVTPVTSLRDRIAPWRETPGVREVARKDYQVASQLLGAPAATLLLDVADRLRIDPVNGWAWLDLARQSYLAGAPAEVTVGALDMSSIAAPREFVPLVGRVNLDMDMWDVATEEQKRRFFSEVSLLFEMYEANDRYPLWWRHALRRQPVARREAIQRAYGAFDSTYEPETF